MSSKRLPPFILLALAFASAHAAPLPPATTAGHDLFAGGTTISAAFLFSSAGDDSDLDVSVNAGSQSFLFSNSNSVTTNRSAIGAIVTFAAAVGDPLVFTLRDLTVPAIWSTGSTSTNVAYTATPNVDTVEAAFGIDLNPAAEAALAALGAIGPVVVIAFEDRALPGSDRDYNDLVFAFSPIYARNDSERKLPEPGSLALLGVGLLAVVLRRRRN